MSQLVWFRNDLRVSDNPALVAACKTGQPVMACFLVTPAQWQEHDWSPARVALILAHLHTLGEELAGMGIALEIIDGNGFRDCPAQLAKLARQHKVDQIHFNEEYGINERRRDRTVRDQLSEQGIQVCKYRDQTVAPVGAIKTQQNAPYSVFTPFSRNWWQWIDQNDRTPLAAPKAIARPIKPPPHPGTPPAFRDPPPALVATGETEAHKALMAFLSERGTAYNKERDFPAIDATSLLSPYLASGILSGRQCLQAGLDALRDNPGAEGIRTWINEICWRDFYIHILYHYPRVSMHRPFKTDTEALTWNQPGDNFKAWKAGRTGVPLVDAAMRQLNQTGWMHNRLRMVTAMFLSKNLFIDWRLGEAYFMSHLVDGFLPSNNGGWQWSASTGTDAAPYFRVFNPATQSERFDPKGLFIRRYVSEVKDLDNRKIHNPGASNQVPEGYVPPIVDLKESRKEAIARFQALKN